MAKFAVKTAATKQICRKKNSHLFMSVNSPTNVKHPFRLIGLQDGAIWTK